MEHSRVRPWRRAGERVLGDHVDEVGAELGEVGGLAVVVPSVDDVRVERALESHIGCGPDEVEARSAGCAERAEHLLAVLHQPGDAGADHGPGERHVGHEGVSPGRTRRSTTRKKRTEAYHTYKDKL